MHKKIVVAFCVCTILTIGLIFGYLWHSKGGNRLYGSNLLSELKFPPVKMKVILAEQTASLNSESAYIKSILSKRESQRLRQWFLKQQDSSNHSEGNLPPLVNSNNPQWTPQATKGSLTGSFTLKSFYHWNCSYIINPKSSTEDVLYFYAIDYFN